MTAVCGAVIVHHFTTKILEKVQRTARTKVNYPLTYAIIVSGEVNPQVYCHFRG